MTAAVAPDLVREELARLVDGEALRRAPSHARLLRYLVERRVANDDTALREKSIALEVFRRDPATYDPRSDPIVRVTMGRLRERLDAHYAQFDAPPKLRIVLPRGGYAPDFVATGHAAPPVAGIAVTRTRTAGAAHAELALAFADRLADRLAAAGLPRVIARTSVDEAQARSAEPRAFAAALGVAWVLDSTLAREGRDELRLSVRLLGAADAEVRWVHTAVAAEADGWRLVDRALDEIVLRTAETLPVGAAVPPAREPVSLPAEARLTLERARLMLLRRHIAPTEEAVTLAESVCERHPDAAEAWATLASALYSRLSFLDRDIGPLAARAIEAADRALALDDGHPVALRTRALFAGKQEGDFERARRLFERALAAMPNYTSARLNFAELLSLAGLHDEAIAQVNLARLHDPLSASVHLARAVCLHYARRYDASDEAYATCRATGEATPAVLVGEGMNAIAAGRTGAAVARFEALTRDYPDSPPMLVGLACAFAAAGETGAAIAREDRALALRPGYSPAHLALASALRRDRATTLARLAAGIDAGDLNLLPTTLNPALDWLDGDRAFRRLRSRVPIWAARAARAAARPG